MFFFSLLCSAITDLDLEVLTLVWVGFLGVRFEVGGNCPESSLRTAPNLPKIRKMTTDVALFLLSSLVTDPSFMSISSLVLELWQFSFIRNWPEIRKSEIPPSESCPISGDWAELWIPNLTWMSLRECYWMLQNVQGYRFYRFWVINRKPTGVFLVKPRLWLKMLIRVCFRDALQPGVYWFVPGLIWLSASLYSKCTVFTVKLCYLQVLAMYKKVLS